MGICEIFVSLFPDIEILFSILARSMQWVLFYIPGCIVTVMRDVEEGVYIRRSQFLDAQLCQPLTLVNSLGKGHTGNEAGSEACSEGITGTSRIIDLARLDGMDFVLLGLLAIDHNDGGQGALGDDSGPFPLVVCLGQSSEVLGNLLDILGLQPVALGIGQSLGLVPDNVVPVRGAGVERVLEELRDERRRQGEHKDLVVLGGLFGKGLDGRWADGEMVTADEVMRGVLDELPDLGALQMVKIVVVGSTQVCAHGAVVSSDHDTAAAGLLLLVNPVLDPETGLLDGVVEDGSVLVITDTAEVDDRVRRKDVLGTPSGVLGSSAGNELCGIVVQEILVDIQVLLFGEDGIVGFQAILCEERIITQSLDIYAMSISSWEVIDRREGKILTVESAADVRRLNHGPTGIEGRSSLHIPSSGFSKQRRAYSLVALMLICSLVV
jgi:hypothetical protein